jgi:hypothetical protein
MTFLPTYDEFVATHPTVIEPPKDKEDGHRAYRQECAKRIADAVSEVNMRPLDFVGVLAAAGTELTERVASGNASDPYQLLKVAGHSYPNWMGHDMIANFVKRQEDLIRHAENWEHDLKGYGLGYFEQSMAEKEVEKRRQSLAEAEASLVFCQF